MTAAVGLLASKALPMHCFDCCYRALCSCIKRSFIAEQECAAISPAAYQQLAQASSVRALQCDI